jgi:hypothetical protein
MRKEAGGCSLLLTILDSRYGQFRSGKGDKVLVVLERK